MSIKDTATDTANFNLTDWLIGGTEHRRKERVDIYLDPYLGAEIAEIEKRRADLEKEQEKLSLDDSKNQVVALNEPIPEARLAAVEEELLAAEAELSKKIETQRATVEIFHLIESESEEASKRAREKHGVSTSGLQILYEILADAAQLNDNKLTAEQWQKLHETVGEQFNNLAKAYARAGEVCDPTFRR